MVRVSHRRSLFYSRCDRVDLPDGLTCREILDRVQPDEILRDYAEIWVDGCQIPRDWWDRIKPRDGRLVGVGYAPRGRSNENAQAGGAAAAALAIAGSIAMMTGVGAPIGVGLLAASLAVGLATQFLLTPEIAEPYSGEDDPRQGVSVRNQLGTDRSVPVLFGEFRFAPPHAAKPYSESVGGEDFYRALFSLSAGLVTTPQIFIGDTPIEQYSDVETEFRRGWHAADIADKGGWSMAGGAFPAAPAVGDHYTISTAGTVSGRAYAAGQTITFNGLAESATASGWDVDVFAPMRLFAVAVGSEAVGTDITSVVDWVDRRTAVQCDEAFIDLLWKNGLIHISKTSQKKANLTVYFEYRYRLVGDAAWTTGQFSETASYGAQFSSSFRVPLPARGQYDIGLRRITPDQTDAQNTDDVAWSVLRSVLAQEPVPIGGISYLAMRIRRTGQLAGALDQVFVRCTRMAREWNGSAWAVGASATPAAAFRAVLQSPIWRGVRSDAQVDLDRLAEWADDSIARGYEYHAWHSGETSVADVLSEIARAGRARPMFRDGIPSVAVDWVQPSAMMLLGPANSRDYSASYAYPRLPHALRCSFFNRDLQWQKDESLLVYADGYSAATATDIVQFDALDGVTSATQAARAARAELAERWLRRERHEVTIGIASLHAEVGDRVDLAHDAIAVGRAYGRVQSMTTDAVTGYVTGIVLDTAIDGDEADLIAVVDRAGSVTSAICTRGGAAGAVTVTTPSAGFAPAVGDVVTVGTVTSSTVACIIDSIAPMADFDARLGMIAYAPAVHEWETRLPDWDAQALPVRQLPAPHVQSVYSGARVLSAAAGGSVLVPQVIVAWAGYAQAGVSIVAFVRPTGTTQPWADADVTTQTATTITIAGIDEGLQYDISLLAMADGFVTSPPAMISAHHVVGRLAPPEDLAGVTIVQIGGQVLLQWDPPADVDVIFGGWVEIRFTSDDEETAWGNTTRVGALVSGHLTYAYRPAQPGRYMLRVYDSGGRASANWAIVDSDQATAVAFTSIGELREDPTFSGDHDGTEEDDGALQLAVGGFDDVPTPDTVANPDAAGGIAVTTGTYTFAAGFDWTTPKRVRLTAETVFALVNTAVTWDSRLEPIDEWPDIDVVDGAPVVVQVWIRTTDDDPAGTPTWSDWQRCDAAEVYCRAVQARCIVGTDISSYNLRLTKLALLAHEVS